MTSAETAISETAISEAAITETPASSAVRPYQHYVYAYPHKTAYRPLRRDDASLRDLWADEPKNALSLYFHIPFCEVRCGFCNLFTRIGAPDGLTTAYLDALERQAAAVREALGEGAGFANAAFGGGTPTFLEAAELERLCDLAEQGLGADLSAIALSVEASPATATADRLAVLAARGTTRLSLGVQSFVDTEARTAVRPQRRADVEAALARIRDAGIPVLNIDLIYGIDGQTEESWRHSLDAALAWRPEELYLYPLYVRPLTGLGRHLGPEPGDAEWDEQRLRLYRHGRDHLLARGYEQVSMRMFRRADAPTTGGEDYACQTDGMVGLGCGARSYTSALHYSFDYAVDMHQIRRIIDDYTARGVEDFRHADFGRRMDAGEARRRHLLQSLLQAEGMPVADYRARFGTSAADDFPSEVERFGDRGWLDDSAGQGVLRLSPEGLAHSDALGPELFSPAVRERMSSYEPK
ncbi:STM4012 family radical SAM protein [Streptomyces sp. KM273126]|uniref:STM4012 family radical SAM protein n=1 Tax=Streptomyces sp. KM273126 TaxID=2545247 RepID=UPI00103FD868|nr:STM4012 family radical SAM protein [Streptomyces sp. KM273126]MBA2806224.1 STM4012 family radical SAM protein [Streptomyces sp. KM273126]